MLSQRTTAFWLPSSTSLSLPLLPCPQDSLLLQPPLPFLACFSSFSFLDSVWETLLVDLLTSDYPIFLFFLKTTRLWVFFVFRSPTTQQRNDG